MDMSSRTLRCPNTWILPTTLQKVPRCRAVVRRLVTGQQVRGQRVRVTIKQHFPQSIVWWLTVMLLAVGCLRAIMTGGRYAVITGWGHPACQCLYVYTLEKTDFREVRFHEHQHVHTAWWYPPLLENGGELESNGRVFIVLMFKLSVRFKPSLMTIVSMRPSTQFDCLLEDSAACFLFFLSL